MNTLSFLSPLLLWGTALAAVPILLHLLYRRRYRRVEWAPMDYLRISMQQNRRQVRLEQILLLALRTLAVVLLFLIVARPVLHATGWGSWLSRGSRTSRILLIDDSLSMAYQHGRQSAFGRAQQLAAQLIRSTGPQNRLTVALTSRIESPIVRDIQVSDPDTIVQQIRAATCTATHASWRTVIEASLGLMDSSTYPIREVTIVTDLRRSGWDEGAKDIAQRLLSAQSTLRVFDVGSPLAANVTVTELVQRDRVALSGASTRFRVGVRNNTSQKIESLEGTWQVDGNATLVKLPPIGPGKTVHTTLTATFQSPGIHHVAFQVSDDELSADNLQMRVVEARDQLSALLVDGQPASEPLAGELDFLAHALTAGAGSADLWRIETAVDSEWPSNASKAPDLIVLANVASVSNAQVTQLKRWVEQGTGLMIFAGDQIDVDHYNKLLGDQGAALLPCRLRDAVFEKVQGMRLANVSPSPLEALGRLQPAVLQRIESQTLLTVDSQPAGSADDPEAVPRVIAYWNDAAESPAVVQKSVGRGSVLLFTTTADRAWTNWPTLPSYVMAVREAALATSRGVSLSRVHHAGQPIRREVPPGSEVGSATIQTPDGQAGQLLLIDAAQPTQDEPAEGVGQQLLYRDTRQAGLYTLSWNSPRDGPQSELIAINPDPRESDLERIATGELRQLLGGIDPVVIRVDPGDVATASVQGKEIWRTLVWGLLGLLAIESGLATWAGRKR